jgi:predicted RNA-binding Zn-ribbon protein involved in translation (DUF1610 family)
MSRYPRTARDATFKCISCNAPVTTTVDDRYVCVSCGEYPLKHNTDTTGMASANDD